VGILPGHNPNGPNMRQSKTGMPQQSIFADIARLRWPMAERVSGSGPFAAITDCGPRPVVCLFETRVDAFNAYREACGPNCRHKHARVELKPPAPRWKKPPLIWERD